MIIIVVIIITIIIKKVIRFLFCSCWPCPLPPMIPITIIIIWMTIVLIIRTVITTRPILHRNLHSDNHDCKNVITTCCSWWTWLAWSWWWCWRLPYHCSWWSPFLSCLDFDCRLRFEIDFCLLFDCTCGNFFDMSIMVILTTMHLKIDRDHVDDDDDDTGHNDEYRGCEP